MTTPGTITDAEEMLSLLRDDPGNRAVAYVRNGDDDYERALVEVNSSCLPKRWLAWLSDEGTAHDLLEAAYDADCKADSAAWAALPLRYGPYCSTWVLAESPHAKKKAGGDEPEGSGE